LKIFYLTANPLGALAHNANPPEGLDIMLRRIVCRVLLLAAASALTACGGGSSGGGGNGPGSGSGAVPIAPTGATAMAGDAQVALSWNNVSGATGYYANRATASGGPYTRLTSATSASFTDTGLANGATYYYVITAYNASGVGAPSSEVRATPLQPGPEGLLVSLGDARVTLTWNTAPGASVYNVKRSLTAGGPYTNLATQALNDYTDTTVTNSTTYFYVVSATRSGVESANSAEVSATPVAATVGPAATINFGVARQTIRGFGGSSAWITDLNAHPGMADRLFGNSGPQQIGLSILRVRIDPSPDPGGHANWVTELSNANLAMARGARVIATPWSPPASMKSNNNVNNGGKLNPGSYADYASYLQSFVAFMQNGGAPLYAISIQNEPDWLAPYESCIWTGAEMNTWIVNHASLITTRLIMPEAVNFTAGSLMSLADPSLNDPAAAAHIDIVGGHLYGTTPTPYLNAVSKNKEVWMTEHTVESTGLQGALDLAHEIHDSMTVGNYNAYLYWWLQNWIVGNSSPYVAGLINDPALDLELTKKGYVMGQFSKFVRPDYVRSDATANPSTGVFVSAYKDSANSRFVIVAINLGTADINQPFTFQNQSLTQLTPHRTSADENLAQLSAVSVVAGSFSYPLRGRSITTFVQ
jgi:glucuronoarabinoxylan endo-1,4-beta-xylanase